MGSPKVIKDIKDRFKISGGTLTGNVEINKSSYPMVMIKDLGQGRRGEFIYNINEEVIISNYKDENNRSLLFLRNENNINNSLQLSRVIDGQWSNYNLYGEHNKPTATDVGALSLNGGGLTGNLSIEVGHVPCLTLRAGTSVSKIIKNANIDGSIVDGTHIQDYPDKNDSTTYTALKIRGNASSLKYSLALIQNIKGSATVYNLYGEHNKPTAADVGALALTGGTLTNTLEIKSAYPAFISTNTSTGQSMRLYHSSNSVILVNRNLADDSTNYRALYLHNSKGASSASNALVLQDCINGTATNHTLLHSGNYIYTLDGAYAKSLALSYDQFDTLTDLGYATKNYCGYADSGHLFVGREWGRNEAGRNFGYQLRVSGWDGTLYTRSFDGWGASWSQWYQYYSTRNIQKGSSSVPSLLPEDGIYIKY